mgnify:CR=1 FL=1
MPSRIIREGIIDSEAVNKLSFPAEVFYRRLMSVVDDFGRFDARVSILRSRLYPLKLDEVREANVQRWLAECEQAGLVRLYSHNSKQYLEFRRLGEPRAKDSKFPAPPPEVEPSNASASTCAQTRADVNGCAQTRADVPYSYSSSDSNSDSNSSGGEPPQPPDTGQSKSKSISGPKPKAEDVPIPASLDTPEFRATWAEWLADRKARGKSVTERAARQQLVSLEVLDPIRAASCIQQSIANGWTGLFPERFQAKPVSANQQHETFEQKQARILREMEEEEAKRGPYTPRA